MICQIPTVKILSLGILNQVRKNLNFWQYKFREISFSDTTMDLALDDSSLNFKKMQCRLFAFNGILNKKCAFNFFKWIS